jgi:hypothetical protein
MKVQTGQITTSNKEFRANMELQKPARTTAMATAESSDKDNTEAAAVVQKVWDKKKAKNRKKQAKA